MMGCITGFLSRLIFLGFWIWTPRISIAFGDTWILPLLGLILAPCTVLVYILAYAPGIGVTGWGWVWLVLAFLLDIGVFGSHTREVRRRREKQPSFSAD